jgi:hypothetical protein
MNIKTQFLQITREEIEKMRMKAYLSFDEIEEGSNVDSNIQYYYFNRKGDKVKCNALYLRDNGDVIVKNENGAQVMVRQRNLHIDKD